MRRLNAIGTAIAGAALIAFLAPTPVSAGPRPGVPAQDRVVPGALSAQPVQADLGVRMSAGPVGRVRLGGLLDYTIKVANAGPAAARNVKVVVSLPRGLGVIGVAPGGCAEQGLQINCGLRSLAAGASAEISV